MRSASALVASFITLHAATARADASGQERPLSKQTGLGYAILATAAPVLVGVALSESGPTAVHTSGQLLVAAGIAVGPSAGLFYARQSTVATVGAVARVALLGGAAVFASQDDGTMGILVPMVLRSTALLWALLDIVQTPSAIRAENSRTFGDGRSIALVPAVFCRGAGGLVAAGTF